MKEKTTAYRTKLSKCISDRRLESGRSSTVVLRGRRGATVYGCRKILLYTPSKITFRLCKEVLSVCGEGLYCTAFSSGTVSLEGKIGTVCFEEADT